MLVCSAGEFCCVAAYAELLCSDCHLYVFIVFSMILEFPVMTKS